MSAVLDFNKIFKIAKGIASAKGAAEHSDDIAQEVLIKAHKLGFVPNIEWEIANMLRREYGDPRSGAGRTKQCGTRYAVRLDAEVSDDSESLGHDIIGSEFIDPLPEPGIERFTGMFGGLEAIVFDLVHIEETNLKEVSETYGFSEAYISVIKKRIDQKLIQAMLPDHIPDELNFELGEIEL